jgi:hypothetical protein
VTTLSPESPPPGLLALGSRIASGDAQWRETDFDVAELAQDARHTVAFDVMWRARQISELERKGEEYLGLARTWLGAHSDHPWQAKLSRQQQAWLADSHEKGLSEREFLPPSGYFGHGVWRPRHGGLETTTKIESWPSRWRISYGWPPTADLRLSTLVIHPDARVLEIREGDDWRRLTERYPLLVERTPFVEQPDVILPAPLYLPNWSDVATDWDGVRITMGGMLASALVVLPVLDGYTVLHDQIADERTLWMNRVFEPVGAPTTLQS